MEIYQVGGCVRDKLLGVPIKDRDFVVVGSTPQAMLNMGYSLVGKDFPVFLHPETKEEYALARKELKTGMGYKGFSVETENITLKEDLYRRDLTINALAISEDGEIIDYYGGVSDLIAKTLRHVSDHFKEDPIRVLRVARFAARFPDFEVHPETLSFMCKLAGELRYITPERIFLELDKVLEYDAPSRFFHVLRDCDALEHLFPVLFKMIGVTQPEKYHPEGDVYNHTMLVLDNVCALTKSKRARFAALTHDFGKTTTPLEELPSHKLHEIRGLSLIEDFCADLKVPNVYKDIALKVCRNHMLAHNVMTLRPKTIMKMYNKLDYRRQPQYLEDFLMCCVADNLGKLREEEYEQAEFIRFIFKMIKEMPITDLVKRFKGKILSDKIYESQIHYIARYACLYKREKRVALGISQMLMRFNKNHPDKKLLFMCVAGSHFFKLNGPESDLDFRGIYLDYHDKKFKGRQIDSKTGDDNKANTKDDIDCTFYSLNRFLYLISKGDFNMLEMLYAPQDVIFKESPLYNWLRKIRTIFISMNISAFIGFIKKEYMKYGVNKDHYNAHKSLFDFLGKYDPRMRIRDLWKDLEEYAQDPTKLIRFTTSRTGNNVYVPSFVVAQRLYQNTITVAFCCNELDKKIQRYGKRMRERTAGVDCKGLYHAQRLIYEAYDIINNGELHLPFSEERHRYLRSIKNGEIDSEELVEAIFKDIDSLKEYDYCDEKRRLYVEDVAERISYNIMNEITIAQMINCN